MAFAIDLSPDAQSHLRDLRKFEQRQVLDAIDLQLSDRPLTPTRHRKPMRTNTVAAWELRVGDLRVYYDVDEEPEPVVTIRAIGVKVRDRVRLGGEEAELS